MAANDDNATDTLYALIKELNAKVTRATVRDELAIHPEFPSLLSLSDVLTGWKIDNTALQLNTVEQLRELPLPFILHLNKNNSWYVLVTKLTGNRIMYNDSYAGRRTKSLDEFDKSWSGIVLLAEADEQSGEAGYAQNRPKEVREKLRGPFALTSTLLIAFFVILSVARDFTAPDWVLLFTKAIGLLFSVLLVAKQLKGRDALTDRLCQLNSKTNCDSVLNSPGAKLWGWLSWADVGLLYFAGGLLTVLLVAVQPPVRSLLDWLALLALPYTIYSVYYQARVVRQWCTLCLAVQVVLLAEGVIATTQLTTFPDSWQPYTALLTAFLLPTLAWVLAKPLLSGQKEGQKYYSELMKFRRDPKLFLALLEKQPLMPPVTADMHPVWLGNPDATHTITMVTNPYCGPCARKHQELEEIVSHNLNVNIQIVFTCDGMEGRNTQTAVHIMAMDQNGPAQEALINWYKQPDYNYKRWAIEFPVDYSSVNWQNLIQHNKQWLEMANISATPTLFINGYKQPDLYSVADTVKIMSYMNSHQPVC